jgi:hypothetical protein
MNLIEKLSADLRDAQAEIQRLWVEGYNGWMGWQNWSKRLPKNSIWAGLGLPHDQPPDY